MSGLWDEHDGVKAYTIITTAANYLLKPSHDGMPVIL
ncbi:MAG: SOS response-associated peptidase family protein, partial [Candidatus Omnitrophica bacterium]|nr:SOS response-associated peptidase family protein [Candidatus Omnitrophota bacterium]